jgi:hypothetical protein
MRPISATDKRLRVWLKDHHGVISRGEAMKLGASDAYVRSKVVTGEWEQIYRGVYRDSASPTTDHQRLRAACALTAPVGVASHQSAAWLWGMTDRPPPRPVVTVPYQHQHGVRTGAVVVHRSQDLDAASVRQRRSIPTTDPLRTLVDLAAAVTPQQLADAVDRALANKLVSIPALLGELNRLGRRGRRGAGALSRLLKDRGFIGVPHPSVLESKAQRLFDQFGLPVPDCETVAGDEGAYRLDFAYPALKLAIEVDGYVWHFSPEHQRRDNVRRNALRLQGWQVYVYTWKDVTQEPARVAAEIAAAYRAAA